MAEGTGAGLAVAREAGRADARRESEAEISLLREEAAAAAAQLSPSVSSLRHLSQHLLRGEAHLLTGLAPRVEQLAAAALEQRAFLSEWCAALEQQVGLARAASDAAADDTADAAAWPQLALPRPKPLGATSTAQASPLDAEALRRELHEGQQGERQPPPPFAPDRRPVLPAHDPRRLRSSALHPPLRSPLGRLSPRPDATTRPLAPPRCRHGADARCWQGCTERWANCPTSRSR